MKLLSPTMLDSFMYYMSCDDDYSQQARQDILDRMNRIKRPPSEAMLKGQKFEDDIVAWNNGKSVDGNDKYIDCVREAAEVVVGGLYQQPVSYQIGDVLFDGFMDFVNRNWIIDTKFTGKYEIGKYSGRCQHVVYLLSQRENGIEHFKYLVSDGRSVYHEDYRLTEAMVEDLVSAISTFYAYLLIDWEMQKAYDNYCLTKAVA